MIRSQLLYIDKEGMSREIFCGMGVEGNLAKWRDEGTLNEEMTAMDVLVLMKVMIVEWSPSDDDECPRGSCRCEKKRR